MAEPKWVKIAVDMFNDAKLKIIDAREDNNLIHYVWTRSILLAGSVNKDGYLYINDNIPYNIKTLAIEFNRSVPEIKAAFKILRKLEMIEYTDDKIFRIKNWDRHQNIEGLEKIRKQTSERVAKHREKKKAAENSIDDNKDNSIKKVEVEAENNEEGNNNSNINNDEINYITQEISCNVTSNDKKDNVTVQNKKKTKKKSKDREKESDSISNTKIDNSSIELAKYCENITGVVSGLDIAALNLAISMHEKENVKKAIDKAIEVNKVNMPYINGILQNWRREGYPIDVGGGNNGAKYNGKSTRSNSSEYSKIKPKTCRVLTEEERRKAESGLL